MEAIGNSKPPAILVSSGESLSTQFKRLPMWAVRALLKRPRFLVAGIAVAVGGAIWISGILATKSWECSGTLLYSPLTMAESQSSMYTPPDVKTLVAIAKEPLALDAISKEFQLDFPSRTLGALFDVSVPNGTKTIEFKLKWEDAEVGAAMVNRLMETFRNTVLDIRLQKIDDYVKGFEAHFRRTTERYNSALQALQDFNQKVSSVDIATEIRLLNEERLELKVDLDRAHRMEANYAQQSRDMDKYIAEIRAKEAKEGEEARHLQTSDETLADNRRRQDRIRELITKERTKIEVESQLKAKRTEQRRLELLVSKGAASRSELEAVSAEIGVIVAKIKENEQISEWEKELDRIDQVVVPKGQSKSVGSPMVQQALTKKLEIELIRTGNQEEIHHLQKELSDKEKRIEVLLPAQIKYQTLSKDVETADLERQAAAAGLNDMNKLVNMRVQELVVVNPAAPSAYPISNRKILIIAFLLLGMGTTVAGVLLIEFLTSTGPTSETLVSNLGLTVLERFDCLEHGVGRWLETESSEAFPLRLFALRLRQAIRSASGVCLFSSVNESSAGAWLVLPLAHCLSRRDERVLVIDAGGDPEDAAAIEAILAPYVEADERAGLAGYLGFLKVDPDEVVLPTTLPAVDCLPHGDGRISVDSLATHRMSEMIEALRERYTMILVIGPRADQQVDLELLAARSDGMIFLGDDRSGRCVKSVSGIRMLAELGAPILGAVIGKASRRRIEKKEISSLKRKRLDKLPA
ncbi:MAG: hypothetical protein SFX72_08770 [Isosphaeraceae bacterium]|nr:hypothetical protein [Isosphaeraceae bacterium]